MAAQKCFWVQKRKLLLAKFLSGFDKSIWKTLIRRLFFGDRTILKKGTIGFLYVGMKGGRGGEILAKGERGETDEILNHLFESLNISPKAKFNLFLMKHLSSSFPRSIFRFYTCFIYSSIKSYRKTLISFLLDFQNLFLKMRPNKIGYLQKVN